MSLFGSDPVREPEPARVQRKASPVPRFEYDVVKIRPAKDVAAAMNAKAQLGWRVISVVQDVDYAGRGTELVVTFERPVA